MVCDICRKNSTMVIIFYAVVIGINIINESTSITCGIMSVVIMFKGIKTKVTYYITRVLRYLRQTRMHYVSKVHSCSVRQVTKTNM